MHKGPKLYTLPSKLILLMAVQRDLSIIKSVRPLGIEEINSQCIFIKTTKEASTPYLVICKTNNTQLYIQSRSVYTKLMRDQSCY